MNFSVIARGLITLVLATVTTLGVISDASAATVATPAIHITTASQLGNTLTIGVTDSGQGGVTIGVSIDGRHAPAYTRRSASSLSLTVAVPMGRHVVCVLDRVPTGRQSTVGCLSVTGKTLASSAQLRSEATLIDPHHTVSWMLGVTPAGSAGQSFMWNNRVLISSSLTAADVRTVVLHEWGHILIWRYFGSTPQGWATAQRLMNRISGLPDGEEHAADCISFILGAKPVPGLGFGCPASLKGISGQIVHH